MIYYTLTIKSLLTDTPMPSQRYAIDGAILIKSIEENIQKVGIIPVTVTNIQKVGVLLVTVQNEQDGGSSSIYYTK